MMDRFEQHMAVSAARYRVLREAAKLTALHYERQDTVQTAVVPVDDLDDAARALVAALDAPVTCGSCGQEMKEAPDGHSYLGHGPG